MQRAVRGTLAQGAAVHPFFARRHVPTEARRARVDSLPAAAALPSPWDTVHVVPDEEACVPRDPCTWPRRARRRPAGAVGGSGAASLWSGTCERRDAPPVPGDPTRCDIPCEAALVPAARGVTPRAPLAYIAQDLAFATRAAHMPAAVHHLHAALMSEAPCALGTSGRASHAALWTDRWRPTCAAHVLGNESAAIYLRDWLHELRVTHGPVRRRAVQTRIARKRGRPRLEGEFDSDEEAWLDQFRAPAAPPPPALTNCIVLEGPTGVGKSAAVYACAAELHFDVFEIFPGLGRRSGKELLSAVGQLGRNHMVDAGAAVPRQSVILLDEVDVLFDDDTGFWPAVVELVGASQRPVILTCTDASQLPLAELPVQRTLHLRAPAVDVAATYLQLVALSEGYIVSQAAMRTLYTSTAPVPLPLDAPSGPLAPTTHLYADARSDEGAPACDLRAALAQLQWACLRTRAAELLKPAAAPGRATRGAEPPATRGASEHPTLSGGSVRQASPFDITAVAALRTMYRALDALSFCDALGDVPDVDEPVSLPPRGRAHVSAAAAAPRSAWPHVRAGRWDSALRAELAQRAQQLAPCACEARVAQDVLRLAQCCAVRTLLNVLHVPLAEQLPRAAAVTEYAPYVRQMHAIDAMRQEAWARQLYAATRADVAALGRATRNSARLALDAGVCGWQWLPLGPAEREAAWRTAL